MISKFVILLAIVVCAQSTPEWVLGINPGLTSPVVNAPVLTAPALGSASALSSGISNGVRTQDALGNYAFNYGIADGIGATNSRAEARDAAGNVRGTYMLRDIDGRARRVDYVADDLGFRASVRTNEPGTFMSTPAATSVVSVYGMPAPPAPVAAAPAIAAAPVFAAAPSIAAAPVFSAAPAIAAAPVFAAAPAIVATGPATAAAAPVAAYSTGISNGVRTQDAIGNYAFNYGIADGIGATNSRSEARDAAGNVRGTYMLRDIDGRARRVDYVADDLGFRASVRTNEPGTFMSTPAATSVVSVYGMPAPPAPVAGTPAIAAAAPVVAAAPIAATTIGLRAGLSGTDVHW